MIFLINVELRENSTKILFLLREKQYKDIFEQMNKAKK